MSSLTWLSVVAYVLGGVFTCVIAFSDQLFLHPAQPWLAAGGAGLVLSQVTVIVRGRETIAHTMAQSLYTVGLCVVSGFSLIDGRLASVVATAIGMITLAGAMRMPRAHVWTLLIVAAGAAFSVMLRSGLGGTQLLFGECAVAGLTCLPGLSVLYYRRQLEAALDQVQELATTDALTGLTNRRGLLERTPLLFAEAVRAERWIAVLLADVDHFKRLNDRLGHLAGDDMLRTISHIVEASMRTTDVVARYGGEEICMVAVLDHEAELPVIAERVRNNVQTETDGVTVSIGAVARRPHSRTSPIEDLMAMIGQADSLLYDAKASGRNLVRAKAI